MEKGGCKMKLSVTLLLAALSGATAMDAATGIAVAADNQITVLYEVFGNDRAMKKGLGLLRARRGRGQANPVRHWQ
jgi:hypothetical protein